MKFKKYGMNSFTIFLWLIIILWIIYVLVSSIYRFWIYNSMNDVILSAFYDREVVTIINTTDDTTSELDDEEIDYFVFSLMGYDMSEEELPVHIPSSLVWERETRREPFESIEENVNELYIEFENDESLTIYYTNSSMEINDVYYTVSDNPLS